MNQKTEQTNQRGKNYQTIFLTTSCVLIATISVAIYAKSESSEADKLLKDSDASQRESVLNEEKNGLDVSKKQLRLSDQLEGEESTKMAAGIDMPNNKMTKLYEGYKLQKEALQKDLDSGLGEKHREVLSKEKQIEIVKKQIASLDSIKDPNSVRYEESIRIAAGLNLPNNGVTELYRQYGEQKDELMKIQNAGMESNHPDVVALKKKMTETKKRLHEAAVLLKSILETQLEFSGKRIRGFGRAHHQR